MRVRSRGTPASKQTVWPRRPPYDRDSRVAGCQLSQSRINIHLIASQLGSHMETKGGYTLGSRSRANTATFSMAALLVVALISQANARDNQRPVPNGLNGTPNIPGATS